MVINHAVSVTKCSIVRLLKFNITSVSNTYGLLAKREVKMAGYWPSSFLCVFMDGDEVEVHKHAKKERGQYPAILTEQAMVPSQPLIISTFKTDHNTGNCMPYSLRDQVSGFFYVPSRQGMLHPALSGCQSQRAIRFIVPLSRED